MMFKIGDQVVHPQHGVGQVVNLEDKEFESGLTRRYYEISMLGGTTVWAPVDVDTVGLHKPAGKSELVRCRQILAARAAPLPEDLRSRQSSLLTRLRQGTISTFCEVVRDLYAFGEHKSLYGTMAGFFRQTQNVLCQEWAFAADITLPDAIEEVTALLEKSHRTAGKSKA